MTPKEIADYLDVKLEEVSESIELMPRGRASAANTVKRPLRDRVIATVRLVNTVSR
jgi:hypothetical protein